MPEPTVTRFRSVEELIDYATNNIKERKTDPKSLLRALELLYKEACQRADRNEKEAAFIFFTRFMMCFTDLRQSKEFKNDEKYYKNLIGTTVADAMKRAEELKKELREKFEKLEQSEQEGKLNTSKNSVDPINKQKPPLIAPQKNGSRSTPINGIATTQASHEKRISITCQELYKIAFQNLRNALLVIDVRLRDDFALSSMKIGTLDVINIPEEIIKPSLIPSKLENELEERFRTFFKKRGDYNQVVILDWFSTKDTLECDKQIPVYLMISKLKKFDPNVKYKNKPVILEGGYDEWLSRYPIYTTNSNVTPPKRKIKYEKICIDQINYPTTAILEPEKIESKTTITTTLPQINSSKPNIDRSTKPVLQEKRLENGIKENGNASNHADNKIASESNENNIQSNKKTSDSKPESFEEDEEELKKQRLRNGRRPALTTLSNQSFSVGNNMVSDSDDDIDEASRNEEKENRMNAMKNASISIYNDMGSGMKRYSSTPNIAKIENEYSKPPIDRSIKPSNDDQLNIFSKNNMYSDEEIKGLRGLLNVGNTCYMNSILQCLSNTDLLRKAMFNLLINYTNSNSKTEGLIAREVSNIIRQLWMKDSSPISCRTLKNYVGRYRDTFRGSEQQDSHEFLTILIDWMHEDLNKPAIELCLEGADEKSGEKAWGEFTSKNNSKIRDLFYGQQKSTVRCRTCEKESVTFEPFSNLSLPLPSAEKCTLAECLKLYTNDEQITGWQCPGCKNPRAATKKLDITKLPPYLVIHFKRFTSDGWCRKRLTNVDFPDLLDMTPFIIGQEHRNRRYELYAVSNHMGTMETGHYTAYCRNSLDKRWYKFDDEHVSPINDVIKSSSAYIVFYKCISSN